MIGILVELFMLVSCENEVTFLDTGEKYIYTDMKKIKLLKKLLKICLHILITDF